MELASCQWQVLVVWNWHLACGRFVELASCLWQVCGTGILPVTSPERS
ncbi:MAG: hypothetical protein F6K47_16935 [Symploca sp. SIO2E6]|nr:hypothetical protein [Symploca sp. SIO2E6]